MKEPDYTILSAKLMHESEVICSRCARTLFHGSGQIDTCFAVCPARTLAHSATEILRDYSPRT